MSLGLGIKLQNILNMYNKLQKETMIYQTRTPVTTVTPMTTATMVTPVATTMAPVQTVPVMTTPVTTTMPVMTTTQVNPVVMTPVSTIPATTVHAVQSAVNSRINQAHLSEINSPNVFTPMPTIQSLTGPHGEAPLGANLAALTSQLYSMQGILPRSNISNNWNNPYGRNIPLIPFEAGCAKCQGTGVAKSSFSRTPIPCPTCYTRHGYCKKCYGTGMHFRKNKLCNVCKTVATTGTTGTVYNNVGYANTTSNVVPVVPVVPVGVASSNIRSTRTGERSSSSSSSKQKVRY